MWKDLAFVVRAGEVPPATLWTTRPDSVCLIVRDTEISIWKLKSASVKDNGLEMTVRKVFFSLPPR